MKVFLTGKRLIILAAALLVAVITIVSINTSGGAGPITDAANAVVRPLKSAVSGIVRTYESLYGYIYEYDKMVAEIESLRAQIAEVDGNSRDMHEILAENERLRALFDFTSRHDKLVLEPGIILSYSASNWSSSYTINRGSSNSEVAVGDCIITEAGILIGQVSEIGSTTSTVVSVVDTTFSAGVTVGDSLEAAVYRGDFSAMSAGYGVLEYLSDSSSVTAGDAVYTSGTGGMFPKDLVVGVIADAGQKPGEVGAFATVTPAMDIKNVTHLYVVTDFEIGG